MANGTQRTNLRTNASTRTLEKRASHVFPKTVMQIVQEGMKYINTCLICFALILPSCRSVDIRHTPGSYTSLSVAIQFIAECLDQDAYVKLSGACIGGRKPKVYLAQHRKPFDMLKEAHRKQSLQDRYPKRQFPKAESLFTLGGHMSQLGCLHVDFVKKDGNWFLGDIWDCK